MRVIAVIDDPRLVEKILRHLGAWHDPPACHSPGAGRPACLPQPRRRQAGLSLPGATGPYTYEPCGDVDPTP